MFMGNNIPSEDNFFRRNVESFISFSFNRNVKHEHQLWAQIQLYVSWRRYKENTPKNSQMVLETRFIKAIPIRTLIIKNQQEKCQVLRSRQPYWLRFFAVTLSVAANKKTYWLCLSTRANKSRWLQLSSYDDFKTYFNKTSIMRQSNTCSHRVGEIESCLQRGILIMETKCIKPSANWFSSRGRQVYFISCIFSAMAYRWVWYWKRLSFLTFHLLEIWLTIKDKSY